MNLSSSVLDVDRTRRSIMDSNYVHTRDEFGRTPLHKSQNDEITMLLIKAGADVNATDSSGKTPLHNAPNKDIAQMLISAGSDVNVRNLVGEKPIDHMRNKLSVDVSPEFRERVSGVIKVLENPCAGVVHLLEEASVKISDLNKMVSELRSTVSELREENFILKRDVQNEDTPVIETPKEWVCTSPYPRLSTDVTQRLNSCSLEPKGEPDSDVVYHTDRKECIKSCSIR